MRNRSLLFVVACALIRPAEAGQSEAAILLAQRPEGKNLAGFWEFPGGKIESGESPEQALARELHEELGINVAEADLQPLSFTSHAYENFHLLMPLYLCRTFSGQPRSCEGQALQWVSARILAADYQLYRQISEDTAANEKAARPKGVNFPLPPADIPLIPALLAALKN